MKKKQKGKKAFELCFHKLGCRVRFIFSIVSYCTDPSGWKHWGKLSICHSEVNWPDLLVHSILPKPNPPTPHSTLPPPKGEKNNKHRPLRIFLLMRRSISLTAAAAAVLVSSAVHEVSQHLPLLLLFFSHSLVFDSCVSPNRRKADCLCDMGREGN